MNRVGLVVHDEKPGAMEMAASLTDQLTAAGLDPCTVEADATTCDVDVLVSIGGDGTLLRAASLAHARDIPVAGINMGRLGYLAEIEPEDVGSLVALLSSPDPSIESRMALEVELPDGSRLAALNDVVLDKVVTQRVIHVRAEVDGRRLITYRADAVIVSTPTGSTAYSLAAGGPVVDPRMEALIVTPVAAHTLLWRSVVVGRDRAIRLIVDVDRPVWVTVDGREAGRLEQGQSVTVTRSDRPVRFLSLGAHHFPDAVRHEFGLDRA
ncbi:MAG: NAD(+)/NADH kinase [Acidimicrobiia bacterium]|nr:NAD(+)/NADH kinase [Acidimicrobiia bacterium]MBT8214311.1 NAD(+)/NADH kinase [Acidimicrobiia bacterium]NNF68633.1 NAD(+)/NADH kinase [Acidimicrobiia bacterium]NNK91161.1 NAD(+)/NADH kinase [Acidimicrobiia bacterium]